MSNFYLKAPLLRVYGVKYASDSYYTPSAVINGTPLEMETLESCRNDILAIGVPGVHNVQFEMSQLDRSQSRSAFFSFTALFSAFTTLSIWD